MEKVGAGREGGRERRDACIRTLVMQELLAAGRKLLMEKGCSVVLRSDGDGGEERSGGGGRMEL